MSSSPCPQTKKKGAVYCTPDRRRGEGIEGRGKEVHLRLRPSRRRGRYRRTRRTGGHLKSANPASLAARAERISRIEPSSRVPPPPPATAFLFRLPPVQRSHREGRRTRRPRVRQWCSQYSRRRDRRNSVVQQARGAGGGEERRAPILVRECKPRCVMKEKTACTRAAQTEAFAIRKKAPSLPWRRPSCLSPAPGG